MKTCLVVDDSGVTRKIARRILEEMDFQIVEAEDGEKALEACQRELPEAILLDWNMPVMDGLEFLGHLRRMPGGDEPKVVFCTTENGIDHIARASRRRQRVHHEAIRQGHRRREIPGNRFVSTRRTRITRRLSYGCLYPVASFREAAQ
jgi:two-component system, chemotaxis family, chemotaxis protein CheY